MAFDTAQVVRFLQQLKARQHPTWQRLQAVRAIEFYRDHVCQQSKPDLAYLRNTLARADRLQRRPIRAAPESGPAPPTSEPLDDSRAQEPELFQSLRRELRLRHYSRRTERAYTGWAKRFLARYQVHNQQQLAQLGAPQVKQFLTDLAVQQDVAASTQNQAFSALLFLFQNIARHPLNDVDAVRAKRPQRLPIVLSHEEIARLLEQLGGRNLLIAQLLYGAGNRIGEQNWGHATFARLQERMDVASASRRCEKMRCARPTVQCGRVPGVA